MRTLLKSLLLIFLVGSFATADAQIIVRTRPIIPRSRVVIAPPPAPSPRHIWVQEQWVPAGPRYRWAGGYWAAPPRPRAVYVPGHWIARPRGYVWRPGYWR